MNSLEQTSTEYKHIKTAGEIFRAGLSSLSKQSDLGKTDEMLDVHSVDHFVLASSVIMGKSRREVSILLDQNSLDGYFADEIIAEGSNFVTRHSFFHDKQTTNIYTHQNTSGEGDEKQLNIQILRNDSQVKFTRYSDSVISNINLVIGDDKMFALWDAENEAGFINFNTPGTVGDLKREYDIR